jgi:hypothetical protein
MELPKNPKEKVCKRGNAAFAARGVKECAVQ